MDFDFGSLSAGTILSAVIISITRIWVVRKSQRETYQRLELASIELFRFESVNAKICLPIWNGAKEELPQEGTEGDVSIKAYVYQILNLFEMAVRFRKQGNMQRDIFATWVAWIFDVCNSESFRTLWTGDMRWNYTKDLTQLLSGGIACIRKSEAEGDDENKTKQKFFDFIAGQFKSFNWCKGLREDDDVIKNWLRAEHFEALGSLARIRRYCGRT